MADRELKDVLMVDEENEIKPRHPWRDVFEEIFGTQFRPSMSLDEYREQCRKSNRDAKDYEWTAFRHLNEDEGPGAA